MNRLMTDAEAHHILQGNMHKFGSHASEETRQKAFNKIKEMAEQGYLEAKYDYAILIQRGKCTNKDPEKAFAMIKELAEMHYPKAELKIGELYETGTGTHKDIRKATEWYFLAVEHEFYYHTCSGLGKIYKMVFNHKIEDSTDEKEIKDVFYKNRNVMYGIAKKFFESTSYPYYGILWMERAAANDCYEAKQFINNCSAEDLQRYKKKMTKDEFVKAVNDELVKRGFQNDCERLQGDIDSIIVGHYGYVDKYYNYEEELRSPLIESIIKDAAGTVMFWY